MIAFVEQGAKFLHPAFVGDRVRSEFVIDKVDIKPGMGMAVVRFAVRLVRELDEPLLEGHHTYLIHTRPTTAASPPDRGAGR
jgi:acyl dehydratase